MTQTHTSTAATAIPAIRRHSKRWRRGAQGHTKKTRGGSFIIKEGRRFTIRTFSAWQTWDASPRASHFEYRPIRTRTGMTVRSSKIELADRLGVAKAVFFGADYRMCSSRYSLGDMPKRRLNATLKYSAC